MINFWNFIKSVLVPKNQLKRYRILSILSNVKGVEMVERIDNSLISQYIWFVPRFDDYVSLYVNHDGDILTYIVRNQYTNNLPYDKLCECVKDTFPSKNAINDYFDILSIELCKDSMMFSVKMQLKDNIDIIW